MILALLLCLCILLAGCNHREAPPNPDQAPAQRITLAFIGALQNGRYTDADALMTSSFRAKSSPNALASQAKGPYKPFAGAQGWQFQPVQVVKHGAGAFLRASFRSADGRTYHTNFIFMGIGSTLALDGVIPPVTSHAPVDSSSKSLSTPKP